MILDKQIKTIGPQQRLAHKMNLKNDTRIDLKNQNSTTGKNEVQKVWLKIFMLSWLFWICFWKFKHKRFRILANFWFWNHTKNMHQLIVIKFSNSLSNYRKFLAPECTFFLCDLSFFFYFSFLTNSFFLLFLTPENTEIQNLIIFLQRI